MHMHNTIMLLLLYIKWLYKVQEAPRELCPHSCLAEKQEALVVRRESLRMESLPDLGFVIWVHFGCHLQGCLGSKQGSALSSSV